MRLLGTVLDKEPGGKATSSRCRHRSVCVAFCFVCKLDELMQYTPGDWAFPLAFIKPGHRCHFFLTFILAKRINPSACKEMLQTSMKVVKSGINWLTVKTTTVLPQFKVKPDGWQGTGQRCPRGSHADLCLT